LETRDTYLLIHDKWNHVVESKHIREYIPLTPPPPSDRPSSQGVVFCSVVIVNNKSGAYCFVFIIDIKLVRCMIKGVHFY